MTWSKKAGPLAGVVVALGLLVVGYWAGSSAVVPPALPLQSVSGLTYRVENGSVSSSTRITVVASWTASGTIFAGRAGVVTSILQKPGGYARPGDVVATVELAPVVVATGSIPMFRTLQKGISGPDVAQYQRLLAELGFYTGPSKGQFDAATLAATKRWQRSIGSAQSGTVRMGSLLFIDHLPARLEVVPAVGELLRPDAALLKVYEAQPRFSSVLSPTERSGLVIGATVAIAAPNGGTWTGKVSAVRPTDDGNYSIDIDGTVCGDSCDVLPVGEPASLNGSIEVVPAMSGPVVPTSALTTEPSGGLSVRLENGSTQPVMVLAQADGFAVVSGVQPGTTIMLPMPDQ